MKNIAAFPTISIFTFLLILTVSGAVSASSGKTHSGSCPVGYHEASGFNEKVCVEPSLILKVVPMSSTDSCPSRRFVRIEGTDICVEREAASLTIDIHGIHIVDPSFSGVCRSNHVPVDGGAYCLADNLSLDLVGLTAKLVHPILDCAAGYEQKPNAIICTRVPPVNVVILEDSVPGVECARGFMRVPGKDVCLAEDIVDGTDFMQDFGLRVPAGKCPKYKTPWKHGGYCVPEYTAVVKPVPCGSQGIFNIEVKKEKCIGPTGAIPSPFDPMGGLIAPVEVCFQFQGSGSSWPIPH